MSTSVFRTAGLLTLLRDEVSSMVSFSFGGMYEFEDVSNEAVDHNLLTETMEVYLAEDDSQTLREPGGKTRENVLLTKSYSFAVDAGKTARTICHHADTQFLGNQLWRSSSSVGANVEEANGAYSPRDFANKVATSLKEARESHYWVRYAFDFELINLATRDNLLPRAEELIKIMNSIIATTKQRYPSRK